MPLRLRILPTVVGLLVAAPACGDDDASPGDGGPDAGRDAGAADAGPPVIVLPDDREACSERNDLKNPYFGDLHVHTALSFDAVTFDVRVRPTDAYDFARGEPLDLPPYDAGGEATRTIRLARPLDFAAVTDHSEFLAETPLCWEPGSPAYDSPTCRDYREGDHERGDFGPLTGVFLTSPPRRPSLCSLQPEDCAEARDAAWREIREAAEAAYDRTSACTFTSFVGYEWTAAPGGTNIHRNVVFRGRTVPRVPTSYVEAPTPEQLWDGLDGTCLETGTTCDALVIPHNSNLAAGTMFVPETRDERPYDRATAERRARMEPLVEIYQHKGASECLDSVPHPMASEDELCGFEQLHPVLCTGDPGDPEDCVEACGPDSGGIGFLGGCVDPQDFVRGALRVGLAERMRVGENPFAFGLVGSTDTHVGAAGAAEEQGHPGHQGDSEDDPEEMLAVGEKPLVRGYTTSPGGLAVVWAEENSRGAIFDAMRRRETYATSGTRPVVRFFGGFEYPDALCDDPDLVSVGYADGVPMGGELGPGPGAPRFVVQAARDPMGAPLQRIQIVKGWLEAGETHERVYEVAGDPDNGAGVDLDSCTPSGDGFETLCSVWTDPDFDPAEPAFYYARVVDNPTCRWTRYVCNDLGVDCGAIDSSHPHWACCDPDRAQTVQERAWTSPIWYYPD